MNHKPSNKFAFLAVIAFNPLIILCNVLTLLLLPRNSMSVDPYYGICNTTRYCGSQQIAYPFHFITHEYQTEKKYLCGYPGYQVSCKNNQTILKLCGDDYVVLDISYTGQSLRLVNSAFLDDANDLACRTWVHNLSLDDGRFKFSEDAHHLYLRSNCSVGIPGNSSVKCPDGREVYGTYALDKKFQCGTTIKVWYSGKYGEDVADINGLLRKGVIVKWTATNCSACLESEGQCGYNETVSRFQCFCPDRPHSRLCHADEPNYSAAGSPESLTCAPPCDSLRHSCSRLTRRRDSKESVLCSVLSLFSLSVLQDFNFNNQQIQHSTIDTRYSISRSCSSSTVEWRLATGDWSRTTDDGTSLELSISSSDTVDVEDNRLSACRWLAALHHPVRQSPRHQPDSPHGPTRPRLFEVRTSKFPLHPESPTSPPLRIS